MQGLFPAPRETADGTEHHKQVAGLTACCHDARECGTSSFLCSPPWGPPSFCLVRQLPVPSLGVPPAGPWLPRTGLACREAFLIGSYRCEPLAHNVGVSSLAWKELRVSVLFLWLSPVSVTCFWEDERQMSPHLVT